MKYLLYFLGWWLSSLVVRAQTGPAALDSLAKQLHQAKMGPQLRQRLDSLEALDKPSPHPPSLQYSLSTDGLVNLGNVSRFLFNQRVTLRYVGGQTFWFELSPSFAYGKTNGELAEREWLGNLNTTVFYQRPVYALLFATAERSNLRAIDSRWLGGVGVGYHYGHRPGQGQRFKCSVSNALIWEVTNFVEDEDIAVVRNSTRLLLDYNFFSRRLLCRHSAFFQPALDQRNVRWSNSLDLRAPLSKVLAVQLSIFTSYESVVAPGRRNYDHRITFGLQVSNWQ
jgi:hypothetical protein